MGLLSWLIGKNDTEAWPVHVDDDNFEAEVYGSELPVLLDVWGPGCAPCKQLEGIVIRLSREYKGRVKVAEINAAECPKAMRRLGVRGTPTVVYFHQRVEVARVVGFRGELYHKEVIEKDLLPRAAEAADKKVRVGAKEAQRAGTEAVKPAKAGRAG